MYDKLNISDATYIGAGPPLYDLLPAAGVSDTAAHTYVPHQSGFRQAGRLMAVQAYVTTAGPADLLVRL